MQCVSRKHFITKQDVRNVCSKVKDAVIMRHSDDPTSVSVCFVCMKCYTCRHMSIFAMLTLPPLGGPLCSWAATGKFQPNINLQGTRGSRTLAFLWCCQIHLCLLFRQNFNWICTKNLPLQCYALIQHMERMPIISSWSHVLLPTNLDKVHTFDNHGVYR